MSHFFLLYFSIKNYSIILFLNAIVQNQIRVVYVSFLAVLEWSFDNLDGHLHNQAFLWQGNTDYFFQEENDQAIVYLPFPMAAFSLLFVLFPSSFVRGF